ncbi:oligosaccharide flippase family protein [Geminicoccaceae bacterium 1502E]|nr:oligosaccharide flippase family protein [Geminicoccaceae bacterium 1502E]
MRALPATRPGDRLAGVLLLGGGRALAALLGFLAVREIALRLDPVHLGLWGMILAVQGLCLHLGEAGLRSVATAEAGRMEGGTAAILRPYLALRLCLSALAVLAGWVAGLLLLPEPGMALPLVLASIPAVALQLDWLALVRGDNGRAAALLLVRPACFLLLLMVAAPATPQGVAAAFLAAWWLAALASWPGALAPPKAPGRDPPPRWRALLSAGLPLAGTTLVNQAMLGLDLLLAGLLIGPAAAGGYWLAASMAVAGLVLANAQGQLALARLGPLRDNEQKFAASLAADCRATSLLGAALALLGTAAAPLAVPLLFAGRHDDTALLLAMLMPWLALQHPSTLLQSALAATGRRPALLRASLAALAVFATAATAAALAGSLPAMALARALGEAVRVALLVRLLPPEARRATLPPLLMAGAGWGALLPVSLAG